MAAGKNRREPVDVERVMHGGFRYEAPRLGQPFGYEQDSGFVTARDAATGALAGSQRVYVVDYSEDMEEDKQDVFIRALALTPDGKHLAIVNERGQHFELGLDGDGLIARP